MNQHICNQEQRLATLESNVNVQNRDIIHLINRLDGLTKGLWALVLTLIPATLSFFGFLAWFMISNKLK